MTTPGQQITTDYEVLNAVIRQVQQVDGLHEGSVWLSAEPVFMGVSYAGDQYIQVVPGEAQDVLSRQGDGYVRDEVRVVVYKRLLVDRDQQQTKQIASRSEGLLQLVESIKDKLTLNYLGGLLTTPLYPIRRGRVSRAPVESMGWASVERVFRMNYRVNFPSSEQNTG